MQNSYSSERNGIKKSPKQQRRPFDFSSVFILLLCYKHCVDTAVVCSVYSYHQQVNRRGERQDRQIILLGEKVLILLHESILKSENISYNNQCYEKWRNFCPHPVKFHTIPLGTEEQGGVILKNKKLHNLCCAKLLLDPNPKISCLNVEFPLVEGPQKIWIVALN